MRKVGHREGGSTARGLGAERESNATSELRVGGKLLGGEAIPVVPIFGGEPELFTIFKLEILFFAKRTGCDRIFFTEPSSVLLVEVGDMDEFLYDLKAQFGVDLIRIHMNAWESLTTSQKGKKDRYVLFKVPPPSAAG